MCKIVLHKILTGKLALVGDFIQTYLKCNFLPCYFDQGLILNSIHNLRYVEGVFGLHYLNIHKNG